jgi:hypothetical protein
MPQEPMSRFWNRYGEEWHFRYDSSKREGILSGSDVDWQEYRVVHGRAEGLILNDEEIRWLRKVWFEATGEQKQMAGQTTLPFLL